MAVQFKPGQLVELNDGRVGWIRFVGDTSFQTGEWIGVELNEATGKNDGSVQGKRYFDCEPGYGLFMRNTGIEQVLEDSPAPTPRSPVKQSMATNGRPMGPPQLKSRPSSVSIAPTRSSRASLAAGPTKRMSMAAAPATSRETGTTASKRQSMAPVSSTVSETKRHSAIRSTPTPTSSKTTAATTRLSLAGSALSGVRTTTTAPRQSINPKAPPTRLLSPEVNSNAGSWNSSKSPDLTRQPSATSTASKTKVTPSTTTSTSRPSTTTQKEIDDLQSRLRVLEKQRTDDRERLLELEKFKEERDRFEMIIQKLQSKYQPQQQENTDLKRQLRDSQNKYEEFEAVMAEHDSVLEMATLDREMAEEKAEAYRAELEAIKTKTEELELENEILREENAEFGKDMSPEELTSKGWMQMQRENGRLREALLRLRDMSLDLEAQLREEVKSLEKDVEELSPIKERYEEQKAKLLERVAEVEDLKEQLEAASSADDLVEQLTDRNIALGEQLEQLRAENQDLQSLTELNDELEVNHVEHEKQLQNEIDYKDSMVLEAARRAAQQDEALNDQEYAISRFRELVTNLQADLEDMKASKEITETEAQALDSRSRAVMDLNRQLQASATNSKVKTIEMEMRKLDAQEAVEHLAIVQLFLPDTFHSERDSVLALLRFKRVGFKARLLHGFIRDKMNAQQDSATATDEHVFEACDALDKLVWISSLCDRFVNSITGCSLEQFARFEGSLHEVEPVERTLNGYIDLLKKDELKEDLVADGLTRSIAVMSHLGERHLLDNPSSFVDQVLMKATLMQSHLENTAAAFHNAKLAILSTLPHSMEDESDGVTILAHSTEEIIGYSRSAKVITGKILRALQDMKARSMSLDSRTSENFNETEALTEGIAAYARKLGRDVHNVLHEESRSEPAGLGEVLTAMRRAADSAFDVAENDTFSTFTFKMRALMDKLAEIHHLATDIDATVEFERPQPPWVLRSKELANSKNVSAEAQHEIENLNRGAKEKIAQLAMQNKQLEEANLKIEHLESRMRDAGQKVTRITELEETIERNKARAKDMTDELAKHMREALEAQAERDTWMAAAAENAKHVNGVQGTITTVGELPASSLKELESLKTDIKYLQQTNHYLKQVARRKQIEQEAADQAWLQTPLVPSREEKDQALDIKRQGLEWLEKLTSLPSTAKMVSLEEREKGTRLKWQPMAMTPQWQLSEQEMLAVGAWPGKKLKDSFSAFRTHRVAVV